MKNSLNCSYPTHCIPVCWAHRPLCWCYSHLRPMMLSMYQLNCVEVRTHHCRIPVCTSNLLLSNMLSCISSICPATSRGHVLVISYSHPRCVYVHGFVLLLLIKLLCPDKYVRMLLCRCTYLHVFFSQQVIPPLICLSSQISSPSLPISCSPDTVPDLVRVSANL